MKWIEISVNIVCECECERSSRYFILNISIFFLFAICHEETTNLQPTTLQWKISEIYAELQSYKQLRHNQISHRHNPKSVVQWGMNQSIEQLLLSLAFPFTRTLQHWFTSGASPTASWSRFLCRSDLCTAQRVRRRTTAAPARTCAWPPFGGGESEGESDIDGQNLRSRGYLPLLIYTVSKNWLLYFLVGFWLFQKQKQVEKSNQTHH